LLKDLVNRFLAANEYKLKFTNIKCGITSFGVDQWVTMRLSYVNTTHLTFQKFQLRCRHLFQKALVEREEIASGNGKVKSVDLKSGMWE
jgi:hypothetical protein